MELEDIFLYVSLIATVALAIYGWRALRNAASLRGWFLAALLGLTAYKNLQLLLHPAALLTPYGVFDMWSRHLLFYAGQLFFFMFINRIIFYGNKDRTKARRNEGVAVAAFLLLAALQLAAPHATHAQDAMGMPMDAQPRVSLLSGELTPYRLLLYLTDQGVQHIIAVIFFIISLAVLRSQSLYAQLEPEAPRRTGLIMPFLIGNAGFISLHVWEYLNETLRLFPSLPDAMGETIEYAFAFFALLMFFRGLRRLHENHL